MKNEGKVFEDCFKSSVDETKYLVKRFNDNAASFGGGFNTRFTSTNECDYMIFNPIGKLFFLELKSTLSSLTFWRKDFEDKSKKQSFQIKKNQILGLDKFNKYENTICGFIFNFREKDNNPTFFVHINDFLEYTTALSKKSINYDDVLKMHPIEISNHKKKVKYSYDVDEFIEKFTE